MLRNIMSGSFDMSSIIQLLAGVFVLFSSIPMHELAHAWAAEKLGDDTARLSGRMTLNPLAHFDLVGALMIVFVGYGWAKPVPVNPNRFDRRITMRAGMAITAVCGPVANLLIAFVFSLIQNILLATGVINYFSETGYYFWFFFYIVILRNIFLALFNLVPIPPLDGSKILFSFLPDRQYNFLMRYERYFSIILILVVFSSILDTPMMTAGNAIYNGFNFITGLPFRLFS